MHACATIFFIDTSTQFICYREWGKIYLCNELLVILFPPPVWTKSIHVITLIVLTLSAHPISLLFPLSPLLPLHPHSLNSLPTLSQLSPLLSLLLSHSSPAITQRVRVKAMWWYRSGLWSFSHQYTCMLHVQESERECARISRWDWQKLRSDTNNVPQYPVGYRSDGGVIIESGSCCSHPVLLPIQ